MDTHHQAGASPEFPLSRSDDKAIKRAVVYYTPKLQEIARKGDGPNTVSQLQGIEVLQALILRLLESARLAKIHCSNGYRKFRDVIARLPSLHRQHSDLVASRGRADPAKQAFPKIRFGTRGSKLDEYSRKALERQFTDPSWLTALEQRDDQVAIAEVLATFVGAVPFEPAWLHNALLEPKTAAELKDMNHNGRSIALAIGLDLTGRHGEQPERDEWVSEDHFLGSCALVIRSLRDASFRKGGRGKLHKTINTERTDFSAEDVAWERWRNVG